jgi:methionyl-tRNA formyltransferase
MIHPDIRLVFMGTPDFAVGILDGLVAAGFNIVSTITAPDKPAGRGQQISQSAVKQYSDAHNIPVLQPTNLKDENFIAELSALQADLFVVVAFRMLPEVVWNMPPKGTINLHASLLPQYRGAAPINWAIIRGEKQTGVTTFFIEQEIDTGLVIERSPLEIGPDETAGELHDRLMLLGRELVVKSVQQIADGSVSRTPQAQLTETATLNAAPKIFKPDCRIDWQQTAAHVHNFCRGLSPYPTAWTSIRHRTKGELRSLKIFRTTLTDIPVGAAPLLYADKSGIYFPCADFYLQISELQPEGKRKMNFKEFSAGYALSDWEIAL